MKSPRKAIALAVIGVVALLLLVGGIKFLQVRKLMAMKTTMPATTVSSVDSRRTGLVAHSVRGRQRFSGAGRRGFD